MIVWLHNLRGIASLLVVISHGFFFYAKMSGVDVEDEALARIGDVGVDIFFVISGYVMALSVNRFVGRPEAWLLKRIVRIYPIYWFYLSLYLLIEVLFNGDRPLTDFLLSYFLLPIEISTGSCFPVLGPGWTLVYEMVFYVATFFVLFIKYKKGWWASLVFLIILYLLPSRFLITPLWSYFLLGFFYYYLRGLSLKKQAVFDLLILTLCIISVLKTPFYVINDPLSLERVQFLGPIAGIAIVLSKYILNRDYKILGYLGTISYTSYLLHYSIGLQSYKKVVLFFYGDLGLLYNLVLGTIFILLLSIVLYELVEKKVLIWIKARL